jgi:dTDP-4-amino-4,6-dideoxygalactose transaminase
MRSRICDLTKITEICKKNDVILIEDCAHALGSTWDGKKVGGYGSVACFSTQTNKLINSGEGGLITTDDEEVAGRIILMSGSYGFYKAGHKIIPSDQLMAQLHDITPNFSMRMTDLTAALIRP